jgi:protein-serine/threonine kinase
VIKRAEYTYAVDWWALGIIMVEGILGKVSFVNLNSEIS